MAEDSVTKVRHILLLLAYRTTRQILWVAALCLVVAGYSLLWHVPGRVYDEAAIVWRAFTGIGLTVGGGLLGVMVAFSRRR